MAFPAFRESTMEPGISLRGRARAGGGRSFRLSEARVFTQGWTGCRCFWRTSGHAVTRGCRDPTRRSGAGGRAGSGCRGPCQGGIGAGRSRPPQGQCRTWISKALSISAAPRPRNSSFWRGTRESDRCSAVVAGEASGRSRQRPGYRSGQDVLRPGRRLLRGPWHWRPALRGPSRGSAAGAGLRPRGGRRAESRSAQCRLSRPARGSSARGTRGRRAAP